MKRNFLQMCVLIASVCTITDHVWDQFGDRFLAGQLMYTAKTFQLYEEYISNINYVQIKEYRSDCNWGFYLRVEKNSKTPMGGIVVRF